MLINHKNCPIYLERLIKLLVEFSIENFRSIRDKVTISMVASSDKSHSDNIYSTKALKNDHLLKVAAIYGPNASGKTNILYALVTLRALVRFSHKNQIGDKLKITPFKLDPEYCKKPSTFEIVFIKNDVRYRYEVSLTNDAVISEKLYSYPNGYKRIMFERDINAEKKYYFIQKKREQSQISEKTAENVLYLSRASNLNYSDLSEVFDWFSHDLDGISSSWDSEGFSADLYSEKEELRGPILRAMANADFGISGINVKSTEIPFEEWLKNSPLKESLIPNPNKKALLEKVTNYEIATSHNSLTKSGDTISVPFDMDEESDGTKRMFNIIGPLINGIIKGKLIFIDELDLRFHNYMITYLISLFQNPDENRKNAQLIFVTHNTNLLTQELFRRDQIWFTEKDSKYGFTKLYSLSEYKPRKDKDIQRGYLTGRYGALPFVGTQKVIDWQTITKEKDQQESQ